MEESPQTRGVWADAPANAKADLASAEPPMWAVKQQLQQRQGGGVAPEPVRRVQLLEELQAEKSSVATFLVCLASLQVPCLQADRLGMAQALIALHQVPAPLQDLWAQRTSKGASWHYTTAPRHVEWAVHPSAGQPVADLALVTSEHDWEFCKATVYATVTVRLVLDAVEAAVARLQDGDRDRCRHLTCVHFNVAAEAVGVTARLLVSKTDPPHLKYELNPGSAQEHYGRGANRLTKRQHETGEAAARVRRVPGPG